MQLHGVIGMVDIYVVKIDSEWKLKSLYIWDAQFLIYQLVLDSI